MIVSGFPVLSQTFVSLQLAELVRMGHWVNVYNLGRRGRSQWLPSGVGDTLDQVQVRHLGTRSRKRKFSPFHLLKVVYLLARRPQAVRRAVRDVLLKRGYGKFSKIIGDAYLLRDLPDLEVDLVHCQFATLVPRVLELRKLGFIDSNPKLVCSVRGFDVAKYDRSNRGYWSSVFDGVDHFFPVCRYLDRTLRDKGCAKPISIVRSPVDVDHIQSLAGKQTRGIPLRLISIGRLIEKKGTLDALGAIRILKDRGIDFRYSIIGDGRLKKTLDDYVRAHGLSDRVRFLGPLPSAETLHVLGSSHILVAPSKMASDGNREGIPNVLKEAMLMGVQVVSTTHAGIPELIEHERNGYLCAENDPEAIAKVIEFVANHSDRWQKTAECAAKTILSEYTPRKTTDDLIEAYRAVIRPA
jgi:colanic acid/amylovoran biosynthesis glycosyltransferase